MIRVDCQAVSKNFHRHSGRQLLRQHARRVFTRHGHLLFHALQDVTFQVHSGESVGIVGRNGAGKSTLLSVICGLAKPDGGHASVNGRIAALLELGAGFHPDLTGRENLLLNAALLGFSEKEARGRFDEIVSFAGLQDFIEEPLRTYSSGMSLRLAFSIAVNLEPEILIVDEVLAVGDQTFQEKCMARVQGFRQAGTTILAVSHSAAMLRGLCDRAIWLEGGRLIMDDSVSRVLDAYAAPPATLGQPR